MTASREAFLGAMRRVAHSVAVVTTDGPAGRHGATVSSFCSVSADPPTVLVCLRRDSRIARTVRGNGAFCVNVLSDSARALAERFARPPRADAPDRFDGVPLAADVAGQPVLADAVSALSCRLADAVDSGSHLVVFGIVLEASAGEAPPLTYHAGRYGSVVARTPPSSPGDPSSADHSR
ncbi:MAG: flavin reductase family protein [Proteobacteria bacterium]|nr:flavin reductase family protein [Pseudomonadota bacterium]